MIHIHHIANRRNNNDDNDNNDNDVEAPPEEVKEESRFASMYSTGSRFDSRSNYYKRRPVSGVPLALQKKMESGDHHISSHLQLITAKETGKSKEIREFLKEALKREVLFDGLEAKLINDIIDVMYKVICEVDDVIIKQGEYGDAYFVVESGRFDVIHQENPTATKKTVGECIAGDAFGEGSLLYSIPRAATLRAIEKSHVWALDAAKFIEIRQKLTTNKNQRTVRVVRFLKKVKLFEHYVEHDLIEIAKATKSRLFKKGDVMVKQGNPSTEFFIIKRGSATVHIRDNNTEIEKMVKELQAGEFFGERGIYFNAPRAATIISSARETKCLVIQANDFKNLLEVPLHHKFEKIEHTYQLEGLTQGIKSKIANKVNCTLDGFEIVGILGVGSFGRVTLVKDPNTQKTYSLKKVRKNKVVETGQEEHVRNERAVLGILNDDFCCRMYGTYQDKLNVYFLMEAILGGELFTVLRWNKRFSEKTARFYTACVVLAFEHLHSKNLIYRDLKPENLLIAQNGFCKLVDFGFAKVRNNSTTLCGTPEYLAPEVIQNCPQGFGVDWWELGIFIYEMVVGNAPFQDDPHKKMYEKILTDHPQFPLNVKFTDKIKDICNKLLQKESHKRLGSGINGAVQVKQHPWFTGLDWDAMFKQDIKPPYKPRIQSNTDVSNFETYPDEDIDEDLFPDEDGTIYKWCEDF